MACYRTKMQESLETPLELRDTGTKSAQNTHNRKTLFAMDISPWRLGFRPSSHARLNPKRRGDIPVCPTSLAQ